jgi:hypothetical protein
MSSLHELRLTIPVLAADAASTVRSIGRLRTQAFVDDLCPTPCPPAAGAGM